MSGNILIVDGLATNRIVLKVKLSAAYFRVTQAGSAEEALTQVAQDRPQAVILADSMPDIPTADLITQLRALPGCDRLAILVLSDAPSHDHRLALLRAGAQDVLAKPLPERLLLARLRAIMRHAPAEADLALQNGTAEALGFAEAQNGFTPQGRIAALHGDAMQDQSLWRSLAKSLPHPLDVFRMSPTGGLDGLTRAPDVLVMSLPGTAPEAGLIKLAELRGAPQTRQARCLVLLDPTDELLAAKVLDMGAHDIAATTATPGELALRVEALLRAKQADDTRTDRLRTGLHAAVTDPLTGLYNRRYAMSQLARIAESARTTGHSFAVMLADLDHFKAVNDTYGHTMGDEVLTKVAHTLRDALRPGDVIARIGGEEFLILMPDCNAQDVRHMARTLCQAVRDTKVMASGDQRPITSTISIGATLANPALRGDITQTDTLLAEADRALYAAKSGGRDTVTISRLSAA